MHTYSCVFTHNTYIEHMKHTTHSQDIHTVQHSEHAIHMQGTHITHKYA